MGDTEKLARIFASSLEGRHIRPADELRERGLVNSDGTLNEKGRASIRVVLAGGVFDIIHPGHTYTINAAKKLGDALVIVVATDKTALKMKGRRPIHNQMQRRELVGSLAAVDAALIGSDNDIFETVSRVMPDVIALGYDQAHQEASITKGCKKIGLDAQITRLDARDPDISSSDIEAEYGKALHGL